MSRFEVKDSGKREEFEGGMVRDTEEGKVDYSTILNGPMFERWAAHLTKAEKKYNDVAPGVPNWTLARGTKEYVRFKKSALRHFIQWFRGDCDEDHAAAVFFNINGAEYLRGKDDIDINPARADRVEHIRSRASSVSDVGPSEDSSSPFRGVFDEWGV